MDDFEKWWNTDGIVSAKAEIRYATKGAYLSQEAFDMLDMVKRIAERAFINGALSQYKDNSKGEKYHDD